MTKITAEKIYEVARRGRFFLGKINAKRIPKIFFSKKAAFLYLLILTVSVAAYFFYGLYPVSLNESSPVIFEIKKGDGLKEIANALEDKGIIRSSLVFQMYSLLNKSAFDFKPGTYKLKGEMRLSDITYKFVKGVRNEVKVIVPEGSNVYDVDYILSRNKIIEPGELINYSLKYDIEGRLFPDTYIFLTNSSLREIVSKFILNFDDKTKSIFDYKRQKDVLIIASILEKEVPGFYDRRIVAGILNKRLKSGMPLQVDSSVCYAKDALNNRKTDCYPITSLDLKINSPYNTYVNKGLPPNPICSPGISAIKAALDPVRSQYWYYLSDPKTGKTIFSKSLDEHVSNIKRYLR